MLVNVIVESDFVKKIKGESIPNITAAEIYMHRHIEEMFPEITKAI